jgi:hypothetical protein
MFARLTWIAFHRHPLLNLPPIRFAVHSLECPPDIHPAESFVHAKISNATGETVAFGINNQLKIIDYILILNLRSEPN